MGQGYDEDLFAELCDALRDFASEWKGVEVIPKLAANVLVGLTFDIDTASYQYDGVQQERLRKAVSIVSSLVDQCVWVEGE